MPFYTPVARPSPSVYIMTAGTFASNLEAMIHSWRINGKSSGENKFTLQLALDGWQIYLPKTYQHAFYTDAHFQGVMNVLQDPNSTLDSLETIYHIVFPEQAPEFTLYYTQMQVVALVEVLFPLTQHIVYARQMVSPTPVPALVSAPAPVFDTVVEEEVIVPVAKKVVAKVIDMYLDNTLSAMDNSNDANNSFETLHRAREFADMVDVRSSMFEKKPEPVSGFGFMVNQDDVQFEYDLERALKASTASAIPEPVPDFGFMVDPADTQYDDDLERALKASMRDC